jgi:hypothetical protein
MPHFTLPLLLVLVNNKPLGSVASTFNPETTSMTDFAMYSLVGGARAL